MAKSLKKCIETLTKSGELSQDLASDIQGAVTSLVAEGYTAKDAAVAAINDALSDLRAELADVEKQIGVADYKKKEKAEAEREKDAKGNPIYKMGDRVEYISGGYEGRHGAISQVTPMVTTVLGLSRDTGYYAQNQSTSYYYHVKTDNGSDFMASPEEIRFETEKPESVTPDITVDGMVMEPRRVFDGIGYAKRSAENARAAAQRARKTSSIADHKRAAEINDKKAQKYQGAWDEWAAKYPAEAEKIAPKPVAAAKVEAPSGSQPSADALKDAGLVVTKTTTKNGKPVWEVSGNTREHSDMLKRAGGRWYGPKKVWSFYNDDPTSAITLKLGGSVAIGSTPTIAMPDKALEKLADSPMVSDQTKEKAKAELAERDEADKQDMSALFDEVLAEETGEPKAAPKPVRSQQPSPKVGAGETAVGPYAAWKHASRGERIEMLKEAGYTDSDQARVLAGTAWVELTDTVRRALSAPPKPAATKPRTAGQAAASAAVNTGKGLMDAIDGLGKLFGSNGSRLSMGVSFDEDTYKKAKPLFSQAVAHFKDAGQDLKEAMRAVVRMVLDKFGPQVTENMRPYIVRFMEDVRDGKIDYAVSEEADNGSERDTDTAQGERDQGQGQRGTIDQSGAGQADQAGLGDRPSGNVGAADEAGASGRPGTGAPSGDVGVGEEIPEGGNAANGRPRAGGAGMADAGTGGRRGGKQSLGGTGGSDQSGERASETSGAAVNYHIADPEQLIGGTPKVRFARNRKAIEALQAIQSEGRQPTQDELDAMAGYIGWGSFGQELFQGTYDRPRPKDGWVKESDWLREHLGKEAWESAQASIINAHYTDPITVSTMWDMARQLGFTGGRVLEPSMGVGNFFGLMPRDLMARSRLAGIEMDKTTGAMAKLLYPEANIQIKPYQDSKTADNFYDLVIGNWPFAKDGPADRRYLKLSPSLHDFFFLKALDQTRPGGLVIGITSAGTMDKQGTLTRAALAEKADLVASFRLPTGAFEKYAGTSVVTDIIILKKRETPNPDVRGSGWLTTVEVDTPNGNPVKVNEYFSANPGNVLGTLNFGHGTTYGRAAMIVDRPADLEARMGALAERLPEGVFEPETTKAKTIQYVTNNTKDRQQSIIAQDGKLFQVQGEYLAPLHEVKEYRVKDGKKTADREAQLVKLIDMRRKHGALIDAERDGLEDVETRRKALSDAYKAFTKAHGLLGESDGMAIIKSVGDPFYPPLAALEIDGKPAAILSRATVRAKKKLEKPTVRDALIMMRNESVFVDMRRVAQIAGVTEDAAAKELLDAGAVFLTPEGTYDVSDVYLSGNVRRKLREAEAAAESGMNMERNIEALKRVIPADVPYFNIEAKLGATWIPPEYYKQFIEHMLGTKSDGIEVRFVVNRWKVKFDDRSLLSRSEAVTTWGSPWIHFNKLVDHAMGNMAVRVWGKDAEGNKVLNEEASAEANEKANKIREEFGNWLWADPVRKIEMERAYNEVMNAIAIPTFDGSFMAFEGMALQRGNSPFDMRSHQGNAVYRGLVNRRGIYAHEVGTGKTYTMGALAVESRRYGIAKKPLIFAHNANSSSVAREINEQYPGAKILYIDNLAPDRIDMTMRQIANDEWDAIVVPHSLISRFALKEETLMEISRHEIEALEQEAIEAANEDGITLTVDMMNDEDSIKKVRSVTAKQLVHGRNQIIKKVQEMALKSSKEGAVSFEDMGIDMIIVDEAHEFKKPPLVTRMSMKGLNKTASNQSISLMFLTDYVKKLNGGTGVHVFTGTPITNTINEIYNMMRFVMDDQMSRDGVREWDAWFNTFADQTSDVELTPAGEYEPVSRLASFVNVPELRRMAGQYMDIVFADDMPEFNPRETKSGKTLASENLTDAERAELLNGRTEAPIGRPYKKIINDVAEMSPEQVVIFDELKRRAASFKAASKKERKEIMLSGDNRNPVLVETAAANAGLDARLYDMEAGDSPDSKVNRVVKNVLAHYNEHDQATQVIFVDNGYTSESISRKKDRQTGQVRVEKKPRFNLVRDVVAKLTEQGIPLNQIAIVDGSVSKEKRKEIADAMNESKIRVVIGQTDTLGVGVNMQANLRAMHHMDAPWMPGELEQRNGRGHRQGNKWNTVLEYRYITERIDGRRWQVLSIKERFIKSFLKADDSVRVIEGDAVSLDEDGDLGNTLSDAAGDPRLLLMNKLRSDVQKLENRERMHAQGIFDAKREIANLKEKIQRTGKALENYRKDFDKFKAVAKDELVIEVGGRKFTDAEKANEAMELAASKVKVNADPIEIANIWGFTITAAQPVSWRGIEYHIIGAAMHQMGKPTVESARATMYGVAKRVDSMESDIKDWTESIPRMEEATKAPFARAKDLEKKRKMLTDIEVDIQRNPVPAPSWLRNGAPAGTEVFVDGKPLTVEGHRYTSDGYYITVSDGDTARDIDYMEAKDENGLPKYEEREFEAPKIIKADDKVHNSIEPLADLSADQNSAISRAIDRAIALELGQEVPPLRRVVARRKIGKLRAQLEANEISEAEFIEQVAQLHADMEEAFQARQLAPHKGRERGADWIRQKLLEAKRRGDISDEAADFAEWFVLKNPALVEDLGISLRTKQEGAASGNYNPATRVMTLFKGQASDTTAVHEILHHLERMMPAEMQEQIRLEWIKQVTKELQKSQKAGDQKRIDYFTAVLAGDQKKATEILTGRSMGGFNAASSAPSEASPEWLTTNRLELPYVVQAAHGLGNTLRLKSEFVNGVFGDTDIGRDYRYLNPSEFWAVSMTDAVSSRFKAKDSIWSRALQWLREALQHIKSVLGLNSTYPMLKALESIAKGDGSFVSREMLGSAQVYAAPRQQPIPAVGAAATPSPTRQTPAPLQGGISGSQSTWNQMPDSKLDDLIRVLQDKHIDTKRTVQAIRAAGRQVADKWDPHLQETLFHGRAAKRTLEFVETELTPLARDMAMRGLTLADLDQYLHARHAEEANALIAGRNPAMPDGGSGMTNQQARDYFANLDPSKLKRLEASAARVDAIIAKTRQTYVSYGLISQETADSWADMFDYYVPLMRDDKDGAMGIGQGFSIKGKEAKSRTGSTRAVVDILANIAMQREKAIVRGEKNRVDIALLGLAKFNPNADFWTVDKVPMITGYNEATGLVETHPDPNYKTRDNVIVGKVPDGKGGIQERAIVFNTENERAMEMVRALKNLDAPKLEGFLGFMAPITRYFASVNTQYNPVFGIANIVRDFQEAMLNLSSTEIAGHRLDVAKHTAGALIGIYQDIRNMRKGSPAISPYAQLWEDFQKQGGQTGYREMFRTSNDRAKAIERAIDPHKWMDSTLGQIFTAGGVLRVPMSVAQDKAGWLFDWLSDYNESLENAIRLSAYKVGLDQGMSAQRAAAMAKGLTVNFNRKGQIALQAGSLYAFFNASAQGTARIAETLFTMDGNDPKSIRLSRAGARIVAGGILFGSLQALMLAWAGFDDDEPPEFVRERNTVIPIGNKKYITIPMPLGFAILPNIGRIATEYALGGFKGAGKSVVKLAGIAADAFNPVGGNGTILQILSPTAIDPLVAIGENKDWTKKPIAKESMDRTVPGHKLWKDTASTPAKVAAEIINTLSGGTKHVAGGLSPTPDQIDYLIGQVTGGVGREASKLEQSIMATYRGEDLPAHKIPLIGRFYGNAADQTSQGATFYNNIRRINELEAEIKGLRKEGRGADAAKFIAENPEARLMMRANYAERQVQKLRKEKHDLVEKDAPRERIKALEDRIKVEMTRFNQAVKESKQRKKEAA